MLCIARAHVPFRRFGADDFLCFLSFLSFFSLDGSFGFFSLGSYECLSLAPALRLTLRSLFERFEAPWRADAHSVSVPVIA